MINHCKNKDFLLTSKKKYRLSLYYIKFLHFWGKIEQQ